nr:ABC transporter ATP-binding protein [Bradyrhizobium sp. CCBAU 21362]
MLSLSKELENPVQEAGDFVVELRSVSKYYGDVAAVANATLSVRRGELLCLLGPSGCGKTTTLRMVAGFVEPSAGTISINGVDMTHQPPYRRDTGMVFQSYALFPHMTVAENIAFGLENLKWPRDKREKRVEEMLKLVELSHLAGRLPRQLSGGQQQRIALARALAMRPAVLLLDEPFSNLDAQLRVRMREELREVIRGVDVTTLFVTHDQEEALTMSDRIVVMNAGLVPSPRDLPSRLDQPSVRGRQMTLTHEPSHASGGSGATETAANCNSSSCRNAGTGPKTPVRACRRQTVGKLGCTSCRRAISTTLAPAPGSLPLPDASRPSSTAAVALGQAES